MSDSTKFFDVSLDEIPEFQSFIREEWGEVDIVNEPIEGNVVHRKYYGTCDGCGSKVFLGYMVMVDGEPEKLFVPRHCVH